MEKLIWCGGVVKVRKLRAEGKKHVLPTVFIVHGKMLQVIIKYCKDPALRDTNVHTNTVNTLEMEIVEGNRCFECLC